MFGFIVLATSCVLIDIHSDFQRLSEFDRENQSFEAIHCTDWSNKAARELGYKYSGREWNGWIKLSGKILEDEAAPMSELLKLKTGWMVEFVNNNSANGRHSVIIQEVLAYNSDSVDVIGVGHDSKRDQVNTKIYRLLAKENGDFADDYSATFNIPVIATYRPQT